MNDKDRDLITQVLQAAGTAGEKGFAYLVQFEWTSALADLFGCLVSLAFLGYLLGRAFRWHPKEDEAHIVRGVVIAICSLVIAIAISSTFTNLGVMLAPEGAAIHSVLAK